MLNLVTSNSTLAVFNNGAIHMLLYMDAGYYFVRRSYSDVLQIPRSR